MEEGRKLKETATSTQHKQSSVTMAMGKTKRTFILTNLTPQVMAPEPAQSTTHNQALYSHFAMRSYRVNIGDAVRASSMQDAKPQAKQYSIFGFK